MDAAFELAKCLVSALIWRPVLDGLDKVVMGENRLFALAAHPYINADLSVGRVFELFGRGYRNFFSALVKPFNRTTHDTHDLRRSSSPRSNSLSAGRRT